MKSRQTTIGAVILIVILIALFLGFRHSFIGQENELPSRVTFVCNDNKQIEAELYPGNIVPPKREGDMPEVTGKAHIELSDGRKLDLPQTISADGARYANRDESFVFWTKGNGALVLENMEEKSYIGCVVVSPETGDLTQIYHGESGSFSIRTPQGFTPDARYTYTNLGAGKAISGTRFTIPQSFATGTNLSSDTYISVEQLPQTESCTASLFLDDDVKVSSSTDDSSRIYSFASSTGAGAGNRYEEEVYAIPGTNPCIAARYFIHYGVIENYPEGAVAEFDRKKLIGMFDDIRNSLVINQ